MRLPPEPRDPTDCPDMERGDVNRGFPGATDRPLLSLSRNIPNPNPGTPTGGPGTLGGRAAGSMPPAAAPGTEVGTPVKLTGRAAGGASSSQRAEPAEAPAGVAEGVAEGVAAGVEGLLLLSKPAMSLRTLALPAGSFSCTSKSDLCDLST